jgi:hypothetical protein
MLDTPNCVIYRAPSGSSGFLPLHIPPKCPPSTFIGIETYGTACSQSYPSWVADCTLPGSE